MFTQMFQILENIDEFSTRFSHISKREKEIWTIMIDMCKKQVSDKLKSICVEAYAEYMQSLMTSYILWMNSRNETSIWSICWSSVRYMLNEILQKKFQNIQRVTLLKRFEILQLSMCCYNILMTYVKHILSWNLESLVNVHLEFLQIYQKNNQKFHINDELTLENIVNLAKIVTFKIIISRNAKFLYWMSC